MSRSVEIDQFIRYVHSYGINNNIAINEDMVYSFLASYGFNTTELTQNSNLFYLFNGWIEHFKNNPSLSVYHNPRQNKFLQFSNIRDNQTDFIKLYVSLNPEALNDGVKMIFNFIAKNNMKTGSKVGSRLRSDFIVLRMANQQDAEKVIEYINSTPFLVNNARPTNPFIHRAGMVGVAYDDCLSYNSVVAHFLSEYINSNKAKEFNNSEFTQYLIERYTKIFVEQSDLNSFTCTKYFLDYYYRIKDMGKDNPMDYTINNFREVLSTVITSVRSENYKEVYEVINDNKENKVDKVQLLNDFIQFAAIKYGDKKYAVIVLERYINGLDSAITRENDYRIKFMSCISPRDVYNITRGNIEQYVNSLFPVDEKKEDFTGFSKEDFDMFILGCTGTYQKYGYDQLRYGLTLFLQGDLRNMTDVNGCRSYFNRKYNREQISDMVNKIANYLIMDTTLDLNIPLEEQVASFIINKYALEDISAGR